MTPENTTITEPQRDVPVAYECDVCVVGGSCTGVFAAVRAAQAGARVAVIENNGFFGGVATAGQVIIWHTHLDTEFKRQIFGGLTLDVVERLKKRSAVKVETPSSGRHYVFNHEELKIELDALVTEHGIRPFLHTKFVAPVMDGKRITHAVIEDKTGRRAIRADQFIDASGDGDLAHRAGFACTELDDLQPPTAVCIYEGIEAIKKNHPDFDIGKVLFNPKYPQALKDGFIWVSDVVGRPAALMIAGTRVHNADCSDADQLTHAEMESRRQIRAMGDILRGNFDGGKGVTLTNLPAYIGIRETRHVDCLHRVTEEEVLHGVRFPDAICQGSYRVDVHHSEKPGITFRYLNGEEHYCVPGKPAEKGRWRPEQETDPTFYQVPFRALVPRESENMLVAGRLMDCDRGAYGALRVMVNCNQTGEAAGLAAAMAADAYVNISDTDTDALRKRLADAGAIII